MARPAGSALPELRGGPRRGRRAAPAAGAEGAGRLQARARVRPRPAPHRVAHAHRREDARGERGAPAFGRGETKSSCASYAFETFEAFETFAEQGTRARYSGRRRLVRLRARFRQSPAVRPDGARGFHARRRRRRRTRRRRGRACVARVPEDAQTIRPGVPQHQRVAETRADPVHVAHTARRG